MTIRKNFNDICLEYRHDNTCRVWYGINRGSQTFPSDDEAHAALDAWADERINEISRDLAAIAKLKRHIKRSTKNG